LFTEPVFSSRTRREFGLHVDDSFAAGQQLLRQPMTNTAGSFHRPGALRPGRSPPPQLINLRRCRPHPKLAQLVLGPIQRHSGV
jgi:hypothetical protein